MDKFDNLQVPLKFSETCPSGLDILGKNLPLPGWVLVVSYESIHRIINRKPFENGSNSQLISISLKFSIHGFESMESS
jgi:hypothetical protein